MGVWYLVSINLNFDAMQFYIHISLILCIWHKTCQLCFSCLKIMLPIFVTGHAMKLTYLVPPYDLLDQKSKSSLPLSVEEVTAKGLGYSVTVCMEGSVAHKLQTSPLISVNRSPGGKR